MTDKIVDRTTDQDCEVWQQHFWEDEKMRAFVLVAASMTIPSVCAVNDSRADTTNSANAKQ